MANDKTMVEDDGWELDKGVFRDFEGVIEDAYFAVDNSYGNGTLCLQLFFTGPDFDKPNRILLSCGKDWTAADANGEEAEHATRKAFADNSGAGLFVKHLVGLPGVREKMAKRGNQRQAKTYRGLKLHMSTIEVDYKGEIGVKEKLVPVAFLGIEDVDQPTNSAPAPREVANTPNAGPDIPEAIVERVKGYVAASATQDEYFAKVDADAEIANDAKLTGWALNPRPTGPWATYKG